MAAKDNTIAQDVHQKQGVDLNQSVASLRQVLASTAAPSGPGPEFIGSFTGLGGCHVFIEKGRAVDYASMRAEQLKGLLELEWLANQEESGSTICKSTADNFRWLAESLVGEISNLIEIVHADATRAALASEGAK